MIKPDITKTVGSFIKNNDTFKLLYSSKGIELINPLTKRLLILDSSFNPPHIGHFSMIKKGITSIDSYNNGIEISTINKNSVLLLFSIKNADKSNVSIDEYVIRLHMVRLMCDYISEVLGVSCGVALINSSLFVDKSHIISDWIKLHNPTVENYFLLGFDTLIRLFDMKYYNDKKNIIESLNPLFENSKILTFLRDDGKLSINQQETYIESIKNCKIMNKNIEFDIPSKWGNNILMTSSINEWGISSSNIRNEVFENLNDNWEDKVIPNIAKFIKDNQLYKCKKKKILARDQKSVY